MTTALKSDFLQEFSALFTQLPEIKQKELISYIRNFFKQEEQEDNQSLAEALAFPKTDIEIEDLEFERINIQLRDCDLGE